MQGFSKRLLLFWIGFALVTLGVLLIFRRAGVYFLPFLFIFPFWVSRRFRNKDFGEGDDDPSDWWKKGKPSP